MRRIKIREEFKEDYISREAGERLRGMILDEQRKKNKIEIDFENQKVASTSFLDEGLAKLALEGWKSQDLEHWVHLKNMDPRDQALFIRLCKDRGLGDA